MRAAELFQVFFNCFLNEKRCMLTSISLGELFFTYQEFLNGKPCPKSVNKLYKAKSSSQPSCSFEVVLISNFVISSWWESMTPPGQDTNLSQISSQQTLWYSFTDLGRMESWVSLLGKKEGHTKIPISTELGITRRTLLLAEEMLPYNSKIKSTN